MQTKLGHLELRVDSANLGFYRELAGFLGWTTLHDGDGMLGIAGSDGASLWFGGSANGAQNDYDGRGVNHLAISAESQSDVDATVAYLKGKGIPALFETPRHRPDFTDSPARTYYQVMFESPDKILFEVVYTGPKQ